MIRLPWTFKPPEGEALTSDDPARELRAGWIILFAFFGLFLGWAAFAPLDAAVVADGVVVVAGSRQTIQHRDGGIVSRIAVQEGQHVEAGDTLIELAAPEVVAQYQTLLAQVIDAQLQRARLVASMSGAKTLATPPEWRALSPEDREIAEAALARHVREAGVGRGTPQWTVYDARLAGYAEESAAVARQDVSLRDELAGMRELAAEQLVPLTRVRALERALADLDARRAELRASAASAREERDAELRKADSRIAELTPQLASAAEQVAQTRVRAPVAGNVVGLSVHTVGGVIRPGERILDLVPADEELVVEAHVRPEDADSIRPGHPSEVRLRAFTGRDLPVLEGKVTRISADRFVDEQTKQGYFIAQVQVPDSEMKRIAKLRGKDAILRPGLPATIVAPTRKRTALQFLLEPLNQALWRSFRES